MARACLRRASSFLGSGAVLAGMVLGAIAVFVIDRRFLWAAGYAAAGAAFSFIGLMHGERIDLGSHWQIALGYLLLAVVCVTFQVLGPPHREIDHETPWIVPLRRRVPRSPRRRRSRNRCGVLRRPRPARSRAALVRRALGDGVAEGLGRQLPAGTVDIAANGSPAPWCAAHTTRPSPEGLNIAAGGGVVDRARGVVWMRFTLKRLGPGGDPLVGVHRLVVHAAEHHVLNEHITVPLVGVPPAGVEHILHGVALVYGHDARTQIVLRRVQRESASRIGSGSSIIRSIQVASRR